MDQRLLAYYNQELRYLRELGGEFAKQFPKVAGRLGLDAFQCADPYVERLLEGFAFLAARVQLKIDAEFPRFTEHLLDLVYPNYLAPTPAMAVVRFEPNLRQGVLTEGFVVPRGTLLRSNLGKGEQTACTFSTAHDVELWPLELISVSHSSQLGDVGEVKLDSTKRVKGVLRFRFRTVDGSKVQQLAIERLPLFIRGSDQLAMRVYELIMAGALGSVVRAPGGRQRTVIAQGAVRPVGFADEEAMLPYGRHAFQGFRLLHEYFALPNRYLFVELAKLGAAVKQCDGPELEVAVLLDRHDPLIETGISPSQFAMFCSPAVNLFSRRADRIHLSDRVNEYHVVPDRTRPLDLEVHTVTQVVGYGTSSEVSREFAPFYRSTDHVPNDDSAAYFTVHRQPRLSSARQRRAGPRSTYAGSEVFLALVDGQEGPYRADLRQLSVDTLCTNRDLPLYMSVGETRTDFFVDSGAPVESVRCLVGPSSPRASHAWGGTSWRLISHLSLNYLTMGNAPEGQAAESLRQMLQLYADLSEPSLRRQIDGIRNVTTQPVVRRLPTTGLATMGRGLEVTVQCDETAFEGTSVFLLGSVLERFFARHASINSFTETVLRTSQRGEIMRWSARLGLRSLV